MYLITFTSRTLFIFSGHDDFDIVDLKSHIYFADVILSIESVPVAASHASFVALMKVSLKTPKSLGPKAGKWCSKECAYCLT